MGNVGPLEVVVVLIIALVIFGPKRIPELGQSVGKAMRSFRAGLDGKEEEEAEQSAEPAHLPPVGSPSPEVTDGAPVEQIKVEVGPEPHPKE
ncbi:MAG: Sec-independent protein translocase subunit TatA/TatB [Actinoallomurus sp.]